MKTKLFILAMVLSAALPVLANPPVEEGKSIFTSRCASCHAVNKNLTGPALAGVDERRSMDWIVAFVKSSQTLVKKGDKDALTVFEQFNKIPMPDHPDLTDANIHSIVEYIKTESKASVEKAPFAKPAKLRPAYQPISFHNYGFFVSYMAVVLILIAVLLFAVQLKEYERNLLSKK
jgi:mono/diheme cytochrome c family protein